MVSNEISPEIGSISSPLWMVVASDPLMPWFRCSCRSALKSKFNCSQHNPPSGEAPAPGRESDAEARIASGALTDAVPTDSGDVSNRILGCEECGQKKIQCVRDRRRHVRRNWRQLSTFCIRKNNCHQKWWSFQKIVFHKNVDKTTGLQTGPLLWRLSWCRRDCIRGHGRAASRRLARRSIAYGGAGCAEVRCASPC